MFDGVGYAQICSLRVRLQEHGTFVDTNKIFMLLLRMLDVTALVEIAFQFF